MWRDDEADVRAFDAHASGDDGPASVLCSSFDLHRLQLLSDHPELVCLRASAAAAPVDDDIALQTRAIILDLLQDGNASASLSVDQTLQSIKYGSMRGNSIRTARQQLVMEKRDRFRQIKMDVATTKLAQKEKKFKSARSKPVIQELATRSHSSRIMDEKDISKYIHVNTGNDIEQHTEIAKARSDLQARMKEKVEAKTAALRSLEINIEKQRTNEDQLLSIKRQEEENEQRHRKILEQVEKLVQLRCLRISHRHFCAWSQHIKFMKANLGKQLIKRVWRQKLTYWNIWKTKLMEKRRRREEAEIMQRLKREQNVQVKADRFYRLHSLSRRFLQWIVWAQAEKITKELQQHHQQRRIHVDTFLAKLAKREPESEDKSSTNKLSSEWVTTTTVTPKPDSSEKLSSIFPVKCRRTSQSIPVNDRFVKAMNEREAIRQKRKIETEILKQTKEALRKETETELARQNTVAEKQRKQEAMQRKAEERRRAKADAKRKQILQEQLLMKLEKAHVYHKRAQMKYYGLQPWKKYIQILWEAEHMAHAHCISRILQQVLFIWRQKFLAAEEQNDQDAQIYYDRAVKRRILMALKRTVELRRHQYAQASMYHTLSTIRATILAWREVAHELYLERIEGERKLHAKADEYARTYIPKVYFRLWRQDVINKRDSRWKEYQRTVMRNKVRGWLSDSRLEQAFEQTSLAGSVAVEGYDYLNTYNSEEHTNRSWHLDTD